METAKEREKRMTAVASTTTRTALIVSDGLASF